MPYTCQLDIQIVAIHFFLAILDIFLIIFVALSPIYKSTQIKISLLISLFLLFICLLAQSFESGFYYFGELNCYYLPNINNDWNIGITRLFHTIQATLGAAVIGFGYFFKLIYQNDINHQYLKINTPFINLSFIIYILSVITYASFYSFYPTDITLLIANTQHAIFALFYYIVIITLLYKKLFKFIKLTVNNNPKLSQGINTTLTKKIIRQTLLIIIIIIAMSIWTLWIPLYLIIILIRFGHNDLKKTKFRNFSVETLYLWYYTSFIVYLIVFLCIYLMFNKNRYNQICKLCDECFFKMITKMIITRNREVSFIGDQSQIDINRSILDLSPLLQNNIDKQKFNDFNCDKGIKCKIINVVIDLLYDYNDNKLDENELNTNPEKIINHFNHLLMYHDNDQQFEFIYKQLNKQQHQQQHINHLECEMFKRHNRRRQVITNRNRNTEEEIYEKKETEFCDEEDQNQDKDEEENMKKELLIDILDRIHSFYYHSYDIKSEETEIISKYQSDLEWNNMINDNNIYSFGYRFDYGEEQNIENELRVNQKYKNIKDEVLNNDIYKIRLRVYYEEKHKCKLKINTEIFKIIQNRNTSKNILFQHILSLLLYCNCDTFQNKWSSTYRKSSSNEKLSSLVKRHSNFYHCSLNLREFIETWGSKLIDTRNKNKLFYHGVSKMLPLQRTVTQFNSPLSTSIDICVAMKFSNNRGIVFSLKYAWSQYPHKSKFIACQYFSDYVYEKECLFLGGIPMMLITNIINVATNEHYQQYINALNIINSILNGTYCNNNDDDDDNVTQLCSDLLSYQLEMNGNDNYPKYVLTLLNQYCLNLKNIMIFWNRIINMRQLKELFCMKDLEFFDLSVLLKIFPQIEKIEYFNKIFINHGAKRINNKTRKGGIKNIIKYILQCQELINQYKLKYIVIHHKTAKLSLNCAYFDVLNNSCKLYQDENKIILYFDNECDIKLIKMRYDEINQGNITQQILQSTSILE